jgi:ParB family transcriptional regulator, chromosome partitioning protein
MAPSLELTPFSKRRYEAIPVDQIKVINSRNRDEEQFDMNVQSIDNGGLLKPIRVNDRFLEKSGFYELICGEGRLIAHQRLKKPTVLAEVVTCSRKEAYLQSLIENIARTKPNSLEFAREVKRLADEGWDVKNLARITCKSDSYIRDYLRLIERGEERLIQGVEQGVFPIAFAVQVATAEDAQQQNILMDAFDAGIVSTLTFAQARKIITARSKERRSKPNSTAYSVEQLRTDIEDATRAKSSYVREAKSKENRFLTLLSGLNELWIDVNFRLLLAAEKLADRPKLEGDFHYVNIEEGEKGTNS